MTSASESAASISNPDEDRASAALSGATKAFRAPPKVAPKPDLSAVKPNRDNGALIAATRSWKKPQVGASNPAASRSLLALELEAARYTASPVQLESSRQDEPLRSSSASRQSSASPDKSQQPYNGSIAPDKADQKMTPAIPAARRSGQVHQRKDSLQTTGDNASQQLSTPVLRQASKELVVAKQKSASSSSTSLPQSRSMDTMRSSLGASDRNIVNAVVGAHLAISRTPPAHRTPIPSPPRHRASLKNASMPGSRTGSPRKRPGSLRQTLRSSESSSSEESTHHYHRPKRHPHKHHEGERKKWRDRVTEEELKRYAGWWAANRGHLVPKTCPFSQSDTVAQAEIKANYRPDEEVANVVVRDLWQRSRLSDHTLQEIWQLVDSRKIGSLTKDEFIVGVWLIDQKLKGHKLPMSISQSVWQSVKSINGVAVKIRVP